MRLAYISLQFPKLRETFVTNEVQELERQGFEVQVFSLLPADHGQKGAAPLSEEARHWREKTLYVPPLTGLAYWRAFFGVLVRHPLRFTATKVFVLTRPHRNLKSRLRTVKRWLEGIWVARELERQGGYEHIHCSFAHLPATSALVVSRLSGLPWSFTSHAIDIYFDRVMLNEKLASASFSVTISDYNRRYLQEHFPAARSADIEVVYLGVDLEKHRPSQTAPADSPLILAVAALDAFKGFPHLLEALALLKSEGVAFSCTIIGDGPQRPLLEELVAKLALGDVLELAGARPPEEVADYFERASVFCLPSIVADNGERDGIPVAIMEALARGLPVVSTTVSGIPEAVEHEESGLLVEPREPEALARALRRLLEDPSLRQRLGEAARRRAEERFDLRQNAARLGELLRRKIDKVGKQ